MKISTFTGFVTPDKPCPLWGYGMRTEDFKGIMHELKCSALVLEIDSEKVVFCDVEILAVRNCLVKNIKARLKENFGLNPEFVTIASVHTHAAPLMRDLEFGEEKPSEEYAAFLEQRIYEIISEALSLEMVEAESFYKTVQVEGFYGNRIQKGGLEDKDVTVVKFVSDEKIAGAIVNISCHPTVLGADNLYVSGDLLGYLSTAFHEKYGVYPVMMQGACGDMSNRNFRQGHDLEELKRTGDGIAAQVFSDDEGFALLNFSKPSADSYSYKNEHQLDLEYWNKTLAETREKAETETDYDKRKILISAVLGIERKIKNPTVTVDFNASILRLGDMEICTQPGELFSHFGKKIKAASSAKLPLIWGYANGYFGYMVDENIYEKTYESTMSPLEAGEANIIADELANLMKKQA